MNDSRSAPAFAGPAIMLLSAAIFGYFGFATSWNTQGMGGQFLLFVALEEWALKGSAIAFAAAAALTFVHPMLGNLVFAVTGALAALLFAGAGVLDVMDARHTAIHPFLLFIFAAWNGYNSWTGLRDVMAGRDAQARRARADNTR